MDIEAQSIQERITREKLMKRVKNFKSDISKMEKEFQKAKEKHDTASERDALLGGKDDEVYNHNQHKLTAFYSKHPFLMSVKEF
jgi:hypothetical protein